MQTSFLQQGSTSNQWHLLSVQQIHFLSIDDKAKVPISVTAAKYQSPLILHMTYEIRLPVHDFAKAPEHKLTHSVYASCEIEATSNKVDEQFTYSGPTYFAIRSMTHDSNTVYTHGYDFNHVMDIPEIESILITSDGSVKPVGLYLWMEVQTKTPASTLLYFNFSFCSQVLASSTRFFFIRKSSIRK